MRHLIHRHIGVRAEGMILAAGIWMLIGLGVAVGVAPDGSGAAFHTTLPIPVRVGLWCGAALIAVITAPLERWSNLGLALLTVAPFIRFCSYLWAWVIDVVPGPPPGDPRGWYSALFYGLMLAFVVLLSHVPATVRAPLSGRHR